MILQVEIIDLRRMIKEKAEEVFADKTIAEAIYNRFVAIEDDDRFRVVSLNDEIVR